MLRRLAGEPLMTLREGATVFALAILIPFAIQGLLVATLGALTAWGSRTSLDEGSTISTLLVVLLLVVTRFILFACYWCWIAVSFGQPLRRGVLAAIPVAGIIWALRMSSNIARGRYIYRGLSTSTRVTATCVGLAALLIIPLSMQAASAQYLGELNRLNSPCEIVPKSPEVQNPVLTVGNYRVGQGDLDEWVTQVTALQRNAVDRKSTGWPIGVLNTQLFMALVDFSANSPRFQATIGDAEALLDEWMINQQSPRGLDQELAELGVAPSQARAYACALATYRLLEASYSDQRPQSGELSQFENELNATAARVGVEVDPAFGYWDPAVVGIVAEEPVAEPGQTAEEPAGADAPVQFSVETTYSIASIPRGEFSDTLAWQANICVGTPDLLQNEYLDRVGLFRREAGRWVKVADAEATSQRGGRCASDQINLLIGATEPPPPVVWRDKGWRTCTPYQVRIPETPGFSPAEVDVCVATQAETVGESA